MVTTAALAVALSTTALVGSASAAGLDTGLPGASARRAAPGDLGMAIMSAAINANGSIARGEGVGAGTRRLDLGLYQVAFGRDITQCAYQASVGESDIGNATPSAIAVRPRSGNPAAVFIRIVNPPDGAAEDRDFFVLVYCGR